MKTPTKKTKPLRGHALLKAAWNFIAEHPGKWNQRIGTLGSDGCGCIAAHSEMMSGAFEPFEHTFDQFKKLCKLTHPQAKYLFYMARTLPELHARVVKICGSRGVLPVPKA